MSKRKQKGFTAIEMSILVAGLASLAIAGSILYAGVHFLIKFW